MPQRMHPTPAGWRANLGESTHPEVAVMISADIEWQVVREIFPGTEIQPTPYGEWFSLRAGAPTSGLDVNFLHGGWGKIAAAASAEYAIQRWNPALLVNIGTCGGFAGYVQKGETILAERTVVYDIIEQMGDFDAHIQYYATEIDLAWSGAELPSPARRGVLVSADRDLLCDEISNLMAKYGAIAGDWESGALAYIFSKFRGHVGRFSITAVNPAGMKPAPRLSPRLIEKIRYRVKKQVQWKPRRSLPQFIEMLREWVHDSCANVSI